MWGVFYNVRNKEQHILTFVCVLKKLVSSYKKKCSAFEFLLHVFQENVFDKQETANKNNYGMADWKNKKKKLMFVYLSVPPSWLYILSNSLENIYRVIH